MYPLLLHLLLLLLLLLFSTDTCNSSAQIVTHLPGFDGPLPFHLETGYVPVEDVELFYYFVHSEINPTEDPLFLWLTGGPGCSGLSGLAFDIGPLNFVAAKYNGSIPSSFYNPYAWTNVANIIFLDSPVGTGFSFSKSGKTDDVGDKSQYRRVYKFLVKWFYDHPEFLSNPLYIAGDSYGGKIVPLVAQKIAEGNNVHPFYNLKGYLVGNPATGEITDMNSRVPFAHGVGIIPDEFYKEIERHCEGEDYTQPNPNKFECYNALSKFDQLYSEVNSDYILGPLCALESPKPGDMVVIKSFVEKYSKLFPSTIPDVNCTDYGYDYLASYWANDEATREALHIKKGTVKEWIRCHRDMNYTKDIPSTIGHHLNLTTRGYRALVYSGDQDWTIPHIGTQAWIRSLNFSIDEDWRSWRVDGQVAGYTRKYINDLTFATVKNAGHVAPKFQPKNCLIMLQRWISRAGL